MYYGSGNYEAFAHPVKPEGVDGKSAYIIGTGLAGLSAAFFLVRDGQMKGEHIHLLEKLDIAGGSCDGRAVPRQRVLYARRQRNGQPLRSDVGNVQRRALAGKSGPFGAGRILPSE